MNEWEKLIHLFEKYDCDPLYIAECVYAHPDSDEKEFLNELINFINE